MGGRVFQEISLDPLAPITVSIYPNSRKRVKVWITIVKCTATGALYGDILETLGRRSMVTFLQRMAYSTGVAPTLVHSDYQPQFSNSSWNPDLEDGKLWKNTKFVRALPRAQRRNSVEANIDCLKSIIEKALRFNRKEDSNVPLQHFAYFYSILFDSKSWSMAPNSVYWTTQVTRLPMTKTLQKYRINYISLKKYVIRSC